MSSKIARFTLLTLAALIFSAAIVSAQETRGSIRGTVTDPNGQAVPNASVQVIDPSRGSRQTLTTNGDGFYQATYLIPGSYQIVVEAGGFKKSIRDNVRLEIGAAIQADLKLEVGGAQETVTVTTDIPPLNTETASLGQVIDARRLEELPLVHGDPYTLIGLSSGVAFTGDPRLDRPFEPTHIVGFTVDGTRGNRSDLTIDGAPSTSTANANEIIASYVPPSDIVQEFKVQTATFDSQFGNTEGGVTSISIKSGTNSLHGSAYYFAEPGDWAANDTFGKARGTARPESKSDRFGGYISGPVRFPWLYNGKDKTFFLFGYEGIRDSRPRFDQAGTPFVPTTAIANGDFSAYACAAGQTTNCLTIYDPLSRTRVNGVDTAQATFANGIIPAARINDVARRVLTYLAVPKQSGLECNICDSTLSEVTKPYDNFTFRVDQNVTNNNHLFVRGSYYDRLSFYNDYTGNEYSGVNFVFKSRQGVIDDVHTFNSTTFLNLKYSYNRFIRAPDQEPDAQGFDLTKLFGPTAGAAYNALVGEDIRRFPRFDFTGGALSNGLTNEFRPTTTNAFGAILNKTIGTHSAKAGAELRIYREDDSFRSNNQTGQFTFDNTFTRQASSGTNAGADYRGLQAVAAFLLGLPTQQTITRAGDYFEYSKTYGLFVQDDWKIRRNVTLNLGLRYELETPLQEHQNKSISGFDPNYVQPIEATVRQRLAANPLVGYTAGQNIDPNTFNVRGGLLFAGVDTGKDLYQTPKDTFLPRLGVAWQLNDKTVVRAGFGLFAGFLGQRRGDVIQGGGFSSTSTLARTTIPNSNGAEIPQSISLFPTNIVIQEPLGASRGRQTGLGNAISFFNQNPKVSKQARYQFGVQRELGWGMVAEATYVGNYGYDIEISKNINALPNQYLNPDNSRTTNQINNAAILGQTLTPNPFAGLIVGAGTAFTGNGIARSQLLRPFPAFGDITTTNNDGKSWYNSAQFNLQKRFSHGYTVNVAYTFSKWLQATEYLNAGDPTPTKMISDQDSPHRLSISGIFALPFGKGQLVPVENRVLERIVGGWQLQANYQYQTGFPIAFTTDLFYLGGPIALSDSERTTDRYFNTAAFISVVNGATSTNATPQSHLRTLPFRFTDVRRDSINNLDLSLLKNTRIKENMNVQFRLEFINALNHPYFPAPIVNPTATGTGAFGVVTGSNQSNYARRAQVGIKFLF